MISPLRGGKLADKIFNKYNITKEEREEVKNEIASGGGGGEQDSEEVWYIITDDTMIPDINYSLNGCTINAMAYYITYYLNSHDEYYNYPLKYFNAIQELTLGISFRPFIIKKGNILYEFKGNTIEDMLSANLDERTISILNEIKPYLRVSTKEEIEEYMNSILNN